MSSSKKKRSHINFTVQKDTIQKYTIQAFAQRVSPTVGVLQTFTYANQVLSEHNRSAVVRVIPDADGWRHPAPYRVFAAKVLRHAYKYTYPGSGGTTTKVWADATDSANGWGASSYVYWGTRLAGGLRVPDVPTSLETQVQVEAKLKLQNGDLNLLTSLGEAKETVAFIASFLTSLASLMAKVLTRIPKTTTVYEDAWYISSNGKQRRVSKDMALLADRRFAGYNPKLLQIPRKQIMRGKVRFQHVDGYLNQAENTWLSTMYAVIPLIADIQAFAKAASEKLRENGAHVSALRTVMQNGGLPAKPVGFYVWETAGHYRFGAECQLNYRLADTHASYLASLGLTNPAALFWELTPYSFVVDWIAPIGNMLQALTADVGLVFESGYTNTKSYCEFAVKCCASKDAMGTFPTVQYTNVCQNRTSLVTSPINGLYFKSPFSTSHVVSAGALAAQLLRRVN